MQELKITVGDITKLDVECIVNAANKSLLGGGGVDGAIHLAAGIELYNECLTLGGCETGEAKITKGYNLKAKYVIHTVGPVYKQIDPELAETQLYACYKNTLELAKANGIRELAFSAISTGIYGYPPHKACATALAAVHDWLVKNEEYDVKIIFCCYNESMEFYYKRAFENDSEMLEGAGRRILAEIFSQNPTDKSQTLNLLEAALATARIEENTLKIRAAKNLISSLKEVSEEDYEIVKNAFV